jgi:hypothetical protein
MNGKMTHGVIRSETRVRHTNSDYFVPTNWNGRFNAKTDPDKCQVLVFNCQETKTFSLYAYNRYKSERVNELCES